MARRQRIDCLIKVTRLCNAINKQYKAFDAAERTVSNNLRDKNS